MPATYTATFVSALNASAAVVWEAVGAMNGVNAELGPWLRMTAPPEAANLRIEDVAPGKLMFESWVLLGGVLPVDRHSFVIAEVERGRGFVERSTSWTERLWEHRRHVESRGEGACTLTDRLAFTPRVGLMGPLLVRVVGAVFAHRHRVLRARFGGVAA